MLVFNKCMNIQNFAKIRQFIDNNPLTVLATLGDDGTPYSAVVYMCADDNRPVLYFMTKNDTQKYKNLSERETVSIASFNETDVATFQGKGRAFMVHDAPTIDMVSKKILRAHATAEDWLPPVVKLHAGAYVLVGIELTSGRLGEFKYKAIGDSTIFTEL